MIIGRSKGCCVIVVVGELNRCRVGMRRGVDWPDRAPGPISIDGARPPLGFRQFQTPDLSNWTATPTIPCQTLIAGVVRIVKGSEGAKSGSDVEDASWGLPSYSGSRGHRCCGSTGPADGSCKWDRSGRSRGRVRRRLWFRVTIVGRSPPPTEIEEFDLITSARAGKQSVRNCAVEVSRSRSMTRRWNSPSSPAGRIRGRLTRNDCAATERRPGS